MKNIASKSGGHVNVQAILDYEKSNGLTEKAFCAQCGISASTYKRIMGGGNCLMITLVKIAEGMHTDPLLLFVL